MKKAIGIISITTILLSLVLYHYRDNSVDKEIISYLGEWDSFNEYEQVSNQPPIFHVSKNGLKAGYLVFGEEVGYQSKIETAALIDTDGNIIKIDTYRQNETPAFYKRLINNNFFDQFIGKNISEGLKSGVNIDAVSHATISSNAAAKSVHDAADYLGNHILSIPIENLYSSIRFGLTEVSILVLFLLVLAAYKLKNKKLRTICLLYSIILLGFKFSLFISYSNFFSIFTGSFPAFSEDLSRYLLFGGSLILIISTGKNLYCGYICPFGAIQEIENKAAKLPQLKISPKIKQKASLTAPFLAWIALVLGLSTGNAAVSSFEPFSLLFGFVGEGIQWVLLPLTVFTALVVRRFYCNTLCPVGFVLNGITKIRRYFNRIWKWKRKTKTEQQI